MEERDAVLRKLKKMQAHEESARKIGSTQEAEAFAQAIQRLLAQYQISMTEVQFTEHLEQEAVDKEMIEWEDYGFKFKRRRTYWIEELSHMVCKAYGCRFLIHPGTNCISVVGRNPNRQVAAYVIGTLTYAADRISYLEHEKYRIRMEREGRVGAARGYRASFLEGMIRRLGQRLEEELNPKTEDCTALVRFDRHGKDAESWIVQHVEGAAEQLKHREATHTAGYRRGVEVADGLDIHGRAIGKESQKERKSVEQ